jgi:large subunit ribosomal protein L29
MKIDEIRGKRDSELDFELENRKQELFQLRFRTATETTNNPSKIGNLRREIARITTVLQERSRGIRGQEPKQ